MLDRARISPGIAATLLLALAASIAPNARWCPLRWEQVDRDALLECAALPISTMASCSTFQALARDAAREGRATCPAGAACPAMNTCPATGACSATDACSARADVPMPASHPVHSNRGKGRAYCLDEPFMSSAVRAAAPSLDHAVAQAAIVVAIATLVAPPIVAHVSTAPEARPPTPVLDARPPIRGPPLLPGELV